MTEDRYSALAREVLSIAKGRVLVRLRFFDRALYELRPREMTPAQRQKAELLLGQPLQLPATEGQYLLYDAKSLLLRYREDQLWPMRAWLHMMVHCLFRHMFVSTLVERPLWNLACDMAVEAMLQSLQLEELAPAPLPEMSGVKVFTAEKIYAWLLANPQDELRLADWQARFSLDDHSLGYLTEPQLAEALGEGGPPRDDGSPGPEDADGGGMRVSLNMLWKEISAHLQVDMETFNRAIGNTAGHFVQSLRAVNRERTDYRSFLRKFASPAEVMRLSPDEFDYVYYTYGMEVYTDMPLVEPLEYREDKRIRDLVIAIDTSGSVQGELVQRFLQKTFNIIKQEESFDVRFNLHIIQCDAQVQEDAVIHTQEEFDLYLQNMQFHGFGGTDFRPVFHYVEKLRRERAFTELKGLLYFTDGCGIFPEKMPPYQTAFIFLERDEETLREVPPWAIRVLLEENEIREL